MPLQMDERTSASSVADARGNDRQARGTCPKMPLACTGTMQKAPRITVQKPTRKEQQSPSDTDAYEDTFRVGTCSLCAARPKEVVAHVIARE